MVEPLSRTKLHERGVQSSSVDPASSRLEGTLNALLDTHERKQRQAELSDPETSPSKSPIDEMRDRFRERLISVSRAVGQRYRAKGIGVTLDTSDLLSGGRTIKIDITFGDHQTTLEGTVMPEAIAFNETRCLSDRGGAVLGGPMLRGQRLSDEGFAEFLYERMIALVRAAGPGPSA